MYLLSPPSTSTLYCMRCQVEEGEQQQQQRDSDTLSCAGATQQLEQEPSDARSIAAADVAAADVALCMQPPDENNSPNSEPPPPAPRSRTRSSEGEQQGQAADEHAPPHSADITPPFLLPSSSHTTLPHTTPSPPTLQSVTLPPPTLHPSQANVQTTPTQPPSPSELDTPPLPPPQYNTPPAQRTHDPFPRFTIPPHISTPSEFYPTDEHDPHDAM